MEQEACITEESLETPALGTNISNDLFKKMVYILGRYYNFEPEPPAAKRSRLCRNEVTKGKVVSMPVDVGCEERFIKAAGDAQTANHQWSPCPALKKLPFRMDDKDSALFDSPFIPKEAVAKLKSRGSYGQRTILRSGSPSKMSFLVGHIYNVISPTSFLMPYSDSMGKH